MAVTASMGWGAGVSDGYQVRVNGTRWPAETVKSAVVSRFSLRSSTGVARRMASGPPTAVMPPGQRRTHGTIEP